MTGLVARARGLTARLAERPIDDPLAILARWATAHELDVLILDEERQDLRTILRGIAGGVPVPRRHLLRLSHLADASTVTDLARRLGSHPLAPAIDPDAGLLANEAALARRYAAVVAPSDPAAQVYVKQAIDGQNAGAMVLLAARGGGLDPAAMFVPGGRLDERMFRRGVDAAFAGTPLAHADSIEEATLRWQLATQARLRRVEPHGLAPVLYLALCWRKREQERRRQEWGRVLGGTP